MWDVCEGASWCGYYQRRRPVIREYAYLSTCHQTTRCNRYINIPTPFNCPLSTGNEAATAGAPMRHASCRALRLLAKAHPDRIRQPRHGGSTTDTRMQTSTSLILMTNSPTHKRLLIRVVHHRDECAHASALAQGVYCTNYTSNEFARLHTQLLGTIRANKKFNSVGSDVTHFIHT